MIFCRDISVGVVEPIVKYSVCIYINYYVLAEKVIRVCIIVHNIGGYTHVCIHTVCSVHVHNLLVRQATHTRHLARSEPIFTENVDLSAVNFLS